MAKKSLTPEQVQEFLLQATDTELTGTIQALIKTGVSPRTVLEGVGLGLAEDPEAEGHPLQTVAREAVATLVADEGVSITSILESIKMATNERITPNPEERKIWEISPTFKFAEYVDGLYLWHPNKKGIMIPELIARRSSRDHHTKHFLILEFLLNSPNHSATKDELLELLEALDFKDTVTLNNVTSTIADLNQSLYDYPIELVVEDTGSNATVTLKPVDVTQ